MKRTRLERLELVTRVQALRADGAHYDRIAATLGISRSYANELVIDPTGERGRDRKRSYSGTCEGCGRRTSGANGPGKAPRLCAHCAARAQRVWTHELILEAIRRFADEHGRPPMSSEWLLEREPGYPAVGTVMNRFGTWAAAVEAAGFPRPRVGSKSVTKTLVCVECGEMFASVMSTTRYCSRKCNQRARRSLVQFERVCIECEAAFTATGRGGRRRLRCYDCQPVKSRQRPLPHTCIDCGTTFVRRHGASGRKRCYDCQGEGERRRLAVPRTCAECGATFTARGGGARQRRRCYDCQPARSPAAPRELVCVDCGEQFTTLPGRGQAQRKHCYACLRSAPPGRSSSTLRRARRKAREALAA